MRRMEEKQRGCYILAGIGWTKEQKVSNGDQVSCEWDYKTPDRNNDCHQFEILEFNISEFK